jgi:hypothetical protein
MYSENERNASAYLFVRKKMLAILIPAGTQNERDQPVSNTHNVCYDRVTSTAFDKSF